MADTKVTDLTAITSLDSSDLLVTVDVSDTTHAASGTTKKITKANLVTDLADETQTLTNKSINLASNTITGTTAEFNTALSDGSFATLAGTEALTNKTLTAPTIAGATVTGVIDAGGATSVEIPNATSVTTNATGEIALDTNGDGSTVTHGVVQVYDGTATRYIFPATGYPSSDNDVMAYDSASNSVTWQSQTGSGGDAYSKWLGAGEAALPSSNFAAFNKITGTNSSWNVLDFDTTTGETAFWNFQVPVGATVGTVTANIIWLCSTGYVATSSDGVAWDITTRGITTDEVLDATTTPSEVVNSGNTTATANGDIVVQSITLASHTWAAGDLVTLELTRDVADAADDLAADARVLGVHIRIQTT